jgi:Na+-driven multidrug efflux pump
MAQANAVFLKGNLFRHISVMSLTSSVGLMAVFLVDFVDMIFISMLGKAELAAAVGYAGAILFFTTSVGIGMAIAGGALVARALGADDEDLARRRATNTLLYGVLTGGMFSAVVWFNLPFLVGFWGLRARRSIWPSGISRSSFRPCRFCWSAWSAARSCGRMGRRGWR